jgi:hypothetical protein
MRADRGRLDALPGAVITYDAVDSAGFDVRNERIKKLRNNYRRLDFCSFTAGKVQNVC